MAGHCSAACAAFWTSNWVGDLWRSVDEAEDSDANCITEWTDPMRVGSLEFLTITDSEGFRSLRAEWVSLCARSNRSHLFSSFDWWLNAWLFYAEPLGQQLTLVTGRHDGRLVLVLPLVTDRRILRMLSTGTFEYRDVIVEPSAFAGQWVRQAWSYVQSSVDADVFILQNLRMPNALAAELKQQPAATAIGGGWCPLIRLDRFANWDAYAATLPKSLIADQRRQWKRISRDMPGISFQMIDSEVELERVMEWVRRHKIAWAEARQLFPGWCVTVRKWENLRRAALAALAERRLITVALRDGDRIVSAGWGFVCGEEYLFYAFAYDAAHSTYSPSRLLLERLVQTCFDRGIRSLDFMPGEQPFKRTWATDYVPTESYVGPLNWRGACLLRLAKTKPLLGSVAETVRPLYRRLPRPARDKLRHVFGMLLTVTDARALKPPAPPPTRVTPAPDGS